MNQVVFVRHGESIWNSENRFTGWVDIGLSKKGIEEARLAGKMLRGYSFDIGFCSLLERAKKTLDIILEEIDLPIPIKTSWRLNERHYGALQGLNKSETSRKYGEEQVRLWRRGYNVKPPLLNEEGDLKGEALDDVVKRIEPYWIMSLAPLIKTGKRIIVSAHGNSLRALIKIIDKISDNDISSYNVPTGTPLVYEFDDGLLPINRYYLGKEDEIQERIRKIENQGKTISD